MEKKELTREDLEAIASGNLHHLGILEGALIVVPVSYLTSVGMTKEQLEAKTDCVVELIKR